MDGAWNSPMEANYMTTNDECCPTDISESDILEAMRGIPGYIDIPPALIDAVINVKNKTFIVATDTGVFHKMRHLAPGKQLIEAPTAGEGATCESCARCPWMGMNALQNLAEVLETGANAIHIDADIREQAVVPIKRMLEFAGGW